MWLTVGSEDECITSPESKIKSHFLLVSELESRMVSPGDLSLAEKVRNRPLIQKMSSGRR